MKSIMAFAIITLCSHMAVAFPGMDLLQSKVLDKPTLGFKDDDVKPTTCANFSGKWKGACKVKEFSQETSFEIKQTGCSMIQMGTEITGIGGLQGRSDLLPNVVSDKTLAILGASSTDWNEDLTQLNLQFVTLMRTVGESKVQSFNGQGTQRLVGNQLLVDVSLKGTALGDISVVCTFDKE